MKNARRLDRLTTRKTARQGVFRRLLRFGAIDTVERFHVVGPCTVQKQVVLLPTGRLDLVLDLQLTVTLHSLGLYSHF